MYDPEQHHRRSIRMREVSYADSGGYFITICTHERECLFGEVVDGEMRSNEVGELVWEEWERTAQVRANVELDAFVVMPNHVHGIIGIVGEGAASWNEDDHSGKFGRGAARCAPTNDEVPSRVNVEPGSLGAIVRAFKSAATKRINALRRTPGAPVWQRNYYEHIIRNRADLERIRRYIAENPGRWRQDRYFGR